MIYVECKPDLTLVKTITEIPNKEIIHAGNKPKVCKHLKKQRNCIGIVDEDPGSSQLPYLKKMKVEKEIQSVAMKILSDSNGNRLIVLCPKLEDWILQCARELNVDTKRYGLPNNPQKLHEIINDNLEKVRKLINDLRLSNRIVKLKDLLMRKGEK